MIKYSYQTDFLLGSSEANKYEKRKGTATMHGQMYEIKMCALLFIKLINLGAKFHLCSNLKEGDDFDDVVAHYTYKNDHGEIIRRAIFIQLKHAQNRDTTRSVSFCEGYFDLNRYFLSFCKLNSTVDLKHKILCSEPRSREYLIFTNANVNTQDVTGRYILSKTNEYNNDLLHNVARGGSVYSIQESEMKEYHEFISIVEEISMEDSSKCKENEEKTKMAIVEMSKNTNNTILQRFMCNVNKHNTEIKKIIDRRKCANSNTFSDFILQFRIYCHQIDEKDLEMVIKIEIEKSISISSEECETIYSKLLEGIKFWWENESYYLTENTSFWTNIVRIVQVSRFSERENEVLSLGIQFRGECLQEIQENLDPNTRVFNIICTGDSTTVTTLKVLQCLKIRQYRDYLHVSLRTLVEKSDIIFKMWPNKWWHTLVVESVMDYKSNEWPFQRMCKILVENSTGVLILISHKQSTFKKYFLESSLKNEYKESFDTCVMNELDTTSQNKLFKKDIVFQGRVVKFDDILRENDIKNIDSDKLEYFLKNEIVILGTDIEVFKIEKYIPRNIEVPTVDDGIFSSNYRNVVLAIEIVRDLDINKFSARSVIFMENIKKTYSPDSLTCVIMRQGKEKEDFKQLCNMFDNVHWIKKDGDIYMWKKSQGDVSVIKSFLKSSSYNRSIGEKIFLKENLQSPVVIVDEPGAGKTTLLSQMACIMKLEYPKKWVVLVKLSEHCRYLNEIQNISKEHVIKLIENSLLLKSNELYFFNLASKNLENFIVLLDAFDEVSPRYTEKVTHIIKLFTDSLFLLYITSRPAYASYIEDEFCTPSYNLTPLSAEAKQQYVFNILESTNIRLLHQKSKILSKSIIEKFSSLCDKENTFTENPLHLKMLAETFCDTIFNEDALVNNELSLNIFEIYTTYVKRKCEIFFGEKKKTDIFNPDTAKDLEEFIIRFTEANKIISAGIHYEQYVENEGCVKSLERLLNKYFLTQNDLIKTGLLSKVSNNSVNYIHISFAEFFFALWIVDNYYVKNKKFIKRIYSDLKYQVVKHFINLKCAEKCAFHTEIILSDKLDFQTLCQSDESLRSTDMIGRRVTHLAAAYDRSEVLKLLIKNHDDLFIEDNIGLTPVDYAIISESWESLNGFLVKMDAFQKNWRDTLRFLKCQIQIGRLKKKIHKKIIDKKEFIVYTCCLKDLTHLLACIKNDVKFNDGFDFKNYMNSHVKNKMYFSYSEKLFLIHIAVFANNIDIVKQLIKYKCDVNVMTVTNFYSRSFTYNALHIASEEGHVDMVKLLIESGCDLNSTTDNKETSLHLACDKGHADVVRVLLENGIYINSKNYCKSTPLHIACETGHAEIVKILIEKYSDVNSKNMYERTPLHVASANGHSKIAKILIENGCDVKCKDRFELNPLHLACEKGQVEVVKLLIESGSGLESTDENQRTSLHIACGRGHIEVATLLIKNGCDVQIKDKYGLTPLHLACGRGHIEIAKLLMENGSDVESKDKDDETSLNLACKNKHVDVIKMLIKSSSTNKETYCCDYHQSVINISEL